MKRHYRYPDQPGSLGGVVRFAKAQGITVQRARRILEHDLGYTLHKPTRRQTHGSAHRTTHRQSTGRDQRRPSGPARVATVRPQADERRIRSLREQDARVEIQTHDRSVSPE